MGLMKRALTFYQQYGVSTARREIRFNPDAFTTRDTDTSADERGASEHMVGMVHAE